MLTYTDDLHCVMGNIRKFIKLIFSEPRFGTQTYQKMSGIENYLKTINTDHYKRGEHPESISYTKRIFFRQGNFKNPTETPVCVL